MRQEPSHNEELDPCPSQPGTPQTALSGQALAHGDVVTASPTLPW